MEERGEARRRVVEGRDLLRQGRDGEAVERFKDAVAIERDNRDYRLSLAEAFLAGSRFGEAESTLGDLLQQDSTDGATNLAMARVLVGKGKVADGISFYHRAIYGQWRSQPVENRVKARFELIDLLARQNAKEELLAELLPLQDAAANDLETRKKLGRLFILAGSSGQAVAIFRDVLHRDAQDADAYAGLGEAEFSNENCRSAQIDFLMAYRLKPQVEGFGNVSMCAIKFWRSIPCGEV